MSGKPKNDLRPMYTYRMEGIVQGMLTAWHELGTDPDDACRVSVYSGVRITKITPLQVYDPLTGTTLPCPQKKV